MKVMNKQKIESTEPKKLIEEIKRLRKRIRELEQENKILQDQNNKTNYRLYRDIER
ncbi:MAG: hypothetical protein QXF35_01335 [Candidatus Bilamarchaeaceae archaeon]